MDITSMLVLPDITVSTALVRMGESGERILFVTDAAGRLLGTVTDGDIRRLILRGESLDQEISTAMNPSPITVPLGFSAEDAESLMVERHVDVLPVMDGARVVDAVRWLDLFEHAHTAKPSLGLPVVIMAGGLGTRLGPLTKVLPKPLVPLGETPIVQLIMDRFAEYGCDDFYLSVNYKAGLIKAYFQDVESDATITFVEETSPLGTAGSLHLLSGQLDATFFVSNCDILIDADYADMLKQHREHENAITVVGSMRRFTIPYGVCEGITDGRIERIAEKPQHDLVVSTGMALVEPRVLSSIPSDRLYHFTDLVNDLIAEGEPVGVYPIPDTSWIDVGQWEQYQELLLGSGPGS